MKKHIIVAVSGYIPNVISETLYVLSVQRNIEISNIISITTSGGKEALLKGLEKRRIPIFFGKNGVIQQLCTEYNLPIPKQDIIVMKDENNIELEDVRSSIQIEHAANSILKEIRQLTSDDDVVLHCVYAGGRRIMATYMGLALTLFGRSVDQFYYASLTPEILTEDQSYCYPKNNVKSITITKEGKQIEVMAETISIELQNIQYMRLGGRYRNILPKNISFSEAVDSLNEISKSSIRVNESVAKNEFLLQTKNAKMKEVLKRIELFAKNESVQNILLYGESGVGKQVLAQYYHQMSKRKGKRFETINTPATSESLFESELFGHKKGSFTSASYDRIGKLEIANGGILFIDEANKIIPQLQSKLLRFIQFKEITPVGENNIKVVDVRLIFAINEHPDKLMLEGRMLPDFYYRLIQWMITIPPLRERKEDIEQLAHHFLNIFASKSQKSIHGIAPDIIEKLINYNWPGNVRELEDVIHKAVVESDEDEKVLSTLSWDFDSVSRSFNESKKSEINILPDNYGLTFNQWIDECMRFKIKTNLKLNNYNTSQTAVSLGMKRTTLQSQIKRLGISVPI
jgi:CRISPR-associated protein (TIGR02584 family)